MKYFVILLGMFSLNLWAQKKVSTPIAAENTPVATPTPASKNAKETIDGRSLLMTDPRKEAEEVEPEMPTSCTSKDGTHKVPGEKGYEHCVKFKKDFK